MKHNNIPIIRKYVLLGLFALLLQPAFSKKGKQSEAEKELPPITLQVYPIVWQDSVLQTIVFEFLEDNELSANEFIEIRGRWPEWNELKSMKLCQLKADYLKAWLIGNSPIPASKIVSYGIRNSDPLVEHPKTREDSMMNRFTDIRIIRK